VINVNKPTAFNALRVLVVRVDVLDVVTDAEVESERALLLESLGKGGVRTNGHVLRAFRGQVPRLHPLDLEPSLGQRGEGKQYDEDAEGLHG
jgi:hypothetical protein